MAAENKKNYKGVSNHSTDKVGWKIIIRDWLWAKLKPIVMF